MREMTLKMMALNKTYRIILPGITYSTYITCKKCKSLLSLDYDVCPVCGAKLKEGAECRLYRIVPRVVCTNCGFLIEDINNPCPMCETKVDQGIKQKIVEVPVEL